MSPKYNQYMNEIISIFIMLLMLMAFTAEQSRVAKLDGATTIQSSVTTASKVATEHSRRSATSDRRFFN
jgi:hypothetical protein